MIGLDTSFLVAFEVQSHPFHAAVRRVALPDVLTHHVRGARAMRCAVTAPSDVWCLAVASDEPTPGVSSVLL
jgi:hypothetical protein